MNRQIVDLSQMLHKPRLFFFYAEKFDNLTCCAKYSIARAIKYMYITKAEGLDF